MTFVISCVTTDAEARGIRRAEGRPVRRGDRRDRARRTSRSPARSCRRSAASCPCDDVFFSRARPCPGDRARTDLGAVYDGAGGARVVLGDPARAPDVPPPRGRRATSARTACPSSSRRRSSIAAGSTRTGSARRASSTSSASASMRPVAHARSSSSHARADATSPSVTALVLDAVRPPHCRAIRAVAGAAPTRAGPRARRLGWQLHRPARRTGPRRVRDRTRERVAGALLRERSRGASAGDRHLARSAAGRAARGDRDDGSLVVRCPRRGAPARGTSRGSGARRAASARSWSSWGRADRTRRSPSGSGSRRARCAGTSRTRTRSSASARERRPSERSPVASIGLRALRASMASA